MARQIPAAKFVELPGDDHIPWIGNADPLAEMQEFLTGEPPVLEADRVLATVLFIDIVQSTQRATAMGDSRWRDLVNDYQQQVSKAVARLGARVVMSLQPSTVQRARLDAPTRLGTWLARSMGIRCGIHTGECVFEGNDVTGIAVHIGARIAARANPGEILLSQHREGPDRWLESGMLGIEVLMSSRASPAGGGFSPSNNQPVGHTVRSWKAAQQVTVRRNVSELRSSALNEFGHPMERRLSWNRPLVLSSYPNLSSARSARASRLAVTDFAPAKERVG